MANETTIFIRNRKDKGKLIKDAIFAFSGGRKSLLIKGEGEEISTAVEVAEILKSRLYPGIEIGNISLGSRPYYDRRDYDRRDYDRRHKGNNNRNNNRNNKNRFKKGIISKIEITLKTTS